MCAWLTWLQTMRGAHRRARRWPGETEARIQQAAAWEKLNLPNRIEEVSSHQKKVHIFQPAGIRFRSDGCAIRLLRARVAKHSPTSSAMPGLPTASSLDALHCWFLPSPTDSLLQPFWQKEKICHSGEFQTCASLLILFQYKSVWYGMPPSQFHYHFTKHYCSHELRPFHNKRKKILPPIHILFVLDLSRYGHIHR